MQSRIQKILVGTVCLGASIFAPAAWAVGVDLVGAATYSAASGTPAPTAAFGLPGGGLNLSFRMGSMASFEVGGYYLTTVHKFDTNTTSNTITGMGGFKFDLARLVFLDLGGYYSSLSTNPMALVGGDYGAYGGLGLRIPLKGSTAILISPKYQYSMHKFTSGTFDITPSQFLLLAGLTFGMNSKN